MSETRGSVAATVAVFAAAAPGLGALLLTLMVLWRQMLVIPEFLGMALMILAPAYLLGIGPALIVGLIAVWLSPRIASVWLWSIAVAAVGAVLAVAVVVFFDPTGGALSLWGSTRLAGPPSALAFLICALLCQATGLRPRPAA